MLAGPPSRVLWGFDQGGQAGAAGRGPCFSPLGKWMTRPMTQTSTCSREVGWREVPGEDLRGGAGQPRKGRLPSPDSPSLVVVLTPSGGPKSASSDPAEIHEVVLNAKPGRIHGDPRLPGAVPCSRSGSTTDWEEPNPQALPFGSHEQEAYAWSRSPGPTPAGKSPAFTGSVQSRTSPFGVASRGVETNAGSGGVAATFTNHKHP
jgi:hypothetical protein